MQGWYRLRSGQLYYGTIPPGVAECRVPSVYLQQQPVEPVESSPAVNPEVPDVDLAADPAEVVDGPVVEDGPTGDDEVDGTVERQAPKPKARRRPSPGKPES